VLDLREIRGLIDRNHAARLPRRAWLDDLRPGPRRRGVARREGEQTGGGQQGDSFVFHRSYI
jgi:hypothetical protein